LGKPISVYIRKIILISKYSRLQPFVIKNQFHFQLPTLFFGCGAGGNRTRVQTSSNSFIGNIFNILKNYIILQVTNFYVN
jgi:hypothetical protein